MWSKSFNVEKIFFSELLFNEFQNAKIAGTQRKIIKHKNRFLFKQSSIILKTSNFFVFKGFRLKYIKIFNYASLFFFRHLQNLKIPKNELIKFNCKPLLWDIKAYPKLSKFISESYLYHNLNTIIPLFLTPALPMIKTICLTKKYLKKKKVIKKKLAKYNLQYVYVPHAQRALVVIRWFGLLVKMQNKSLVNDFISIVLNISQDDENSFIIQIRNQVYKGLSLESDY